MDSAKKWGIRIGGKGSVGTKCQFGETRRGRRDGGEKLLRQSPPPSFRSPRRRREGASQVLPPRLRPLPLPMPHRSRKGLDGEGEKKFCLSVGDPRGR